MPELQTQTRQISSMLMGKSPFSLPSGPGQPVTSAPPLSLQSATRCPKPDIHLPASDIQNQTSNIAHPTANIRHRTSHSRYPKPDIRYPLSNTSSPVVFFDLAQTLVTTTALSPRRLVASRLGLSEKQTKTVGRLIMTHPATEPSSLAQALKKTLADVEQWQLERVLEEVWEEQHRCLRAIDGAPSVMATLKSKGFRLGLLSNTWHPLYTAFLDRYPEMASLLDHLVLSYRLGWKKPSAEIFRHALTLANAPPEQCWMIGDSYELDIEPALMAGMHAIWVLRHPEKEPTLLAQVLRGDKPPPDSSVVHLGEIMAYFTEKGPLCSSS